MSTLNNDKAFRLWINNQLFIRVTRDGYAIGPCYEGALGCVLQVLPLQQAIDEENGDLHRRHRNHAGLMALKIPRMMADTISENYYISDILEYEETVVFNAGAANALTGLVPSPPGNRFLLRGLRQLEGCYDLDQNGSILFLSFSKERFPRFCNVKKDNLSTEFRLQVFPPDAADAFSFLDQKTWELIYSETTECERPKRPLYVPTSCEPPNAKSPRSDMSRIQALSKSIVDKQSSSVWYVALPSISYNWAYSTLQESISKKRHKNWTVKDIYGLLNSVLTGVQTLHKNGSLHGDIRPANIMTVNQQTEHPESYVLGDYGSFSMNDHLYALEGPIGGHSTMAGPGISRHRTSIFYAPERRNGVERETADTAVILNRPVSVDGDNVAIEYLVHFGWHKDLADSTGKISATTRERIYKHWDHMTKTESDRRASVELADWEMRRRDRIRVRDYVFTITDSLVIEEQVYFRCHGRYASVLHERMAIYTGSSETIPERLMNIPHYVEIRQWSAATDLYGIGVLALYLIFSSGLARSGLRHNSQNNTENMLSEILSLLDSKQNFKYLWSDLERFRRYLEYYEERKTAEELRSVSVKIGDDVKELYQYGLDFVAIIARTIKYVDLLLLKFEYNIAHFLLFMHFVLSCLHRQTSTLPDKDDSTSDVSKFNAAMEHVPGTPMPPFCVDRCDGVEEFLRLKLDEEGVQRFSGPAFAAAERLKDLRVRFDQGKYVKFVCPEGEVPKYDPSSEFQAKIEKDKLRRECDKQAAAAKLLQERIATISTDSENKIEEVRKEWKRETENLRKQQESRFDRLTKDHAQRTELSDARTRAIEAECEVQKDKLRASIEKLKQEISELRQDISAKNAAIELKANDLKEVRNDLKSSSSEIARLQSKLHKVAQTVEIFEGSIFGGVGELKDRIRSIL